MNTTPEKQGGWLSRLFRRETQKEPTIEKRLENHIFDGVNTYIYRHELDISKDAKNMIINEIANIIQEEEQSTNKKLIDRNIRSRTEDFMKTMYPENKPTLSLEQMKRKKEYGETGFIGKEQLKALKARITEKEIEDAKRVEEVRKSAKKEAA